MPAAEKKDLQALVAKCTDLKVTVTYSIQLRDLSSAGGLLGIDGYPDNSKSKLEAEALAKKLADVASLGIESFALIFDSRKSTEVFGCPKMPQIGALKGLAKRQAAFVGHLLDQLNKLPSKKVPFPSSYHSTSQICSF